MPVSAPVPSAHAATRWDLEIRGMTCASCVRRVEAALRKVPGVEAATVNLATSRASIVSVPGGDVVAAVAQAVRNAGYEPAETAVEFEVRGMTCASCVRRAERALASVPGVTGASVNLATGRATVRGVAVERSQDELIAAVGKAGYEAEAAATPMARAEADDGAKAAEVASLQRSVLTALAATIPLLILEMGPHLSEDFHHWLSSTLGRAGVGAVSLGLASIVQFGPGLRFYRKGLPALLRLAPDMNSLVVLGTSAAYLYSAVAVLAPALLPVGTVNTYFEAAAVIITLVLVGRWLETRAKGRAGQAIRRLMTLQAKTATLWRDGREQEVPVDAVRVGDVVIVRPGQRVPVDGEVLDGSSFVDESMVTGEPIPVQKGPGALVVGGTINKSGTFRLEAKAVGADTLLAQIVRTVEAAQASKLPIQALVDQVTAWFVPAIIAIAAVTFVAWLALGPTPAMTYALVNAVAVLIIACPCAMGLATPTSIMVGTGKAAELGILFRRGEALQALKDAEIIALDKTGTLTLGSPRLTDVVLADGADERRVLQLLASAEARSEHPVAAAIVAGASERTALVRLEPSEFEAIPGLGLRAVVDGQEVWVGADRLMAARNLDVGPLKAAAARLARDGKTPVYAAVDGRLAAVVAVADPIKPTALEALKALRALGRSLVMVTGDNRATAEAIAAQLGVSEVVAEVLPTEKAEVVKRLQESGRGRVAFVGDGINDAPALAQADVGIAIGTGTDIAIESADVVLMSGDLRNVATAIGLSSATIRNIKQNLAWAFGYNAILIPVAAGILYPPFGILLSPILASAAMAVSSVSVVANALRLKRFAPAGSRGPDGDGLSPAVMAPAE